jgi:beta-mannosidase
MMKKTSFLNGKLKPLGSVSLFLVGLICCCSCSSIGQIKELPEIRELHQNWEFVEEGKTDWKVATVPGVVHTDLLAHKLIPDPWYGLNEKDIQWVEKKNWEYRLNFEVSKEEKSNNRIDLIFEGLDTYASIYLNNIEIGSAENMYRTWKFDVRELIVEGKNELRVVFESPVNKWRDFVVSAPIALPASSEEVDVKVSPYVRKAPYHFGWDWGPRYVTSGIWRPVYLKFSKDAQLKDVQVHQQLLTDSLAVIRVDVDFSCWNKADYTVFVGAKQVDLLQFSGDTTISTELRIEQPRRWWPLGWGEQYLYDVKVRVKEGDVLKDEKSRKIGLRTVELIRDEDSLGRSFYFKVNGHPLFARGANYIPQSNFLPSVRKSQYDSLIQDVKAVNMNMIRVWGGGIYEDDYFYELCDENGILIWHDFMFAGTMYPGDKAFFENVAVEIEQNVKRLRNHPSIAHWNGNNEIEVAWHQWGWQKKYKYSKEDSTLLYNNYLRLFDSLIPTILNRVDSNRSFTPTSPERSFTKLKETKSGTVHYWGVWHAGHAFEKYRQYIGRFMAEWGFQSFPDMETIHTFSDSSDWALDSEVMKWHQKSPVGNGMIEKQGLNYFDKPKSFEEFVEFSQLTQALAMRVAIDAHRLAEYNSGTLYWQLNDCWPGPSWSSRDVFGRWKEIHKQLEWIYAPVAIIPQRTSEGIEFVLINDLIANQSLQLTVQIGGEKTVLLEKTVDVAATSRTLAHIITEKEIRKQLEKGIITLQVELRNAKKELIFKRTIDKYDMLTY